jgi:hypothetical protein
MSRELKRLVSRRGELRFDLCENLNITFRDFWA